MGKKLAIKGHPTRGKEIIKLLEIMGGNINKKILSAAIIGDVLNPHVYFFDPDSSDNRIVWYYLLGLEHDGRASEMMIFTLEEFLEKYPFYNGDKVFDIADGDPGIITAMKWDEDVSDMKYHVAFDNGDMGWYTNDTIGFLNEDNKEMNGTIETNHSKVNGLKRGDEYPIMEGVECNEYIKYYFPDGYEFVDTDDTGVYLKPIKPKHPTTYEECCEVLGIGSYFEPEIRNATTEECHIFMKLIKIKRCRNAYWKIAGEQMGLGKPWEPNWTTFEGMPAIFRFRYNIVCDSIKNQHCLLVFPTKEMRDAFYENFKDLIEQCKELL